MMDKIQILKKKNNLSLFSLEEDKFNRSYIEHSVDVIQENQVFPKSSVDPNETPRCSLKFCFSDQNSIIFPPYNQAEDQSKLSANNFPEINEPINFTTILNNQNSFTLFVPNTSGSNEVKKQDSTEKEKYNQYSSLNLFKITRVYPDSNHQYLNYISSNQIDFSYLYVNLFLLCKKYVENINWKFQFLKNIQIKERDIIQFEPIIITASEHNLFNSKCKISLWNIINLFQNLRVNPEFIYSYFTRYSRYVNNFKTLFPGQELEKMKTNFLILFSNRFEYMKKILTYHKYILNNALIKNIIERLKGLENIKSHIQKIPLNENQQIKEIKKEIVKILFGFQRNRYERNFDFKSSMFDFFNSESLSLKINTLIDIDSQCQLNDYTLILDRILIILKNSKLILADLRDYVDTEINKFSINITNDNEYDNNIYLDFCDMEDESQKYFDFSYLYSYSCFHSLDFHFLKLVKQIMNILYFYCKEEASRAKGKQSVEKFNIIATIFIYEIIKNKASMLNQFQEILEVLMGTKINKSIDELELNLTRRDLTHFEYFDFASLIIFNMSTRKGIEFGLKKWEENLKQHDPKKLRINAKIFKFLNLMANALNLKSLLPSFKNQKIVPSNYLELQSIIDNLMLEVGLKKIKLNTLLPQNNIKGSEFDKESLKEACLKLKLALQMNHSMFPLKQGSAKNTIIYDFFSNSKEFKKFLIKIDKSSYSLLSNIRKYLVIYASLFSFVEDPKFQISKNLEDIIYSQKNFIRTHIDKVSLKDTCGSFYTTLNDLLQSLIKNMRDKNFDHSLWPKHSQYINGAKELEFKQSNSSININSFKFIFEKPPKNVKNIYVENDESESKNGIGLQNPEMKDQCLPELKENFGLKQLKKELSDNKNARKLESKFLFSDSKKNNLYSIFRYELKRIFHIQKSQQ